MDFPVLRLSDEYSFRPTGPKQQLTRITAQNVLDSQCIRFTRFTFHLHYSTIYRRNNRIYLIPKTHQTEVNTPVLPPIISGALARYGTPTVY